MILLYQVSAKITVERTVAKCLPCLCQQQQAYTLDLIKLTVGVTYICLVLNLKKLPGGLGGGTLAWGWKQFWVREFFELVWLFIHCCWCAELFVTKH